ncbi:MAG: ROK family transcriptional regulator [Bacteroidales bacterium]|nr:ROK family transcriptional regulator [Bacteroidales bacterium]
MELWESDINQKYAGKDLRKILQKKRIIRYLHNKGPQSNAYLAKKLNISVPTIQTILNELIENELVEEQGQGDSSGGRRPNIYGLADKSFYTMGIDIGRYTTRIAIYNHLNENITGTQILNQTLESSLEFVDQTASFALKLISENKISSEKIIGIGINMPGLIDSDLGINYTYLNFEKPIREIFEEKLGVRIFIENDARARALAELKFGVAKGHSNVLVLHVDWGVGLGMILNGRLYRGSSGFSGEFSHIPIIDQGALCNCGKHGCLETIASGMALAKRVEEGIAAGNESMLKNLNADNHKYTLETIIDAANSGDHFTISLISNMAQYLGKGIATLVQILNPELIILGGRVSKANEYLITPIKQALYLYCIPKLRENTDIIISEFDKEAGVLGAIAVVTERIFE